jgi:hypothetical protein
MHRGDAPRSAQRTQRKDRRGRTANLTLFRNVKVNAPTFFLRDLRVLRGEISGLNRQVGLITARGFSRYPIGRRGWSGNR